MFATVPAAITLLPDASSITYTNSIANRSEESSISGALENLEKSNGFCKDQPFRTTCKTAIWKLYVVSVRDVFPGQIKRIRGKRSSIVKHPVAPSKQRVRARNRSHRRAISSTAGSRNFDQTAVEKSIIFGPLYGNIHRNRRRNGKRRPFWDAITICAANNQQCVGSGSNFDQWPEQRGQEVGSWISGTKIPAFAFGDNNPKTQ